MYAKIADGKLEVFDEKTLKYTKEIDGEFYYVQVINPGEDELNEALYYKVLPEIYISLPEKYTYQLCENKIIIKEENSYEETFLQ